LPALYRNGHFTNVAASLGPGVGSVEAINELGHAGGDYVVNLPNGRAQPLYYDGTSATLLPFRGGFVDINEHDVLVTADGKIYDHGKLRGIPRLDAGHGGNQAAAINDLGQVVGTSSVRGANFIKASPFMYFNGVMTDLGSLGGDYADARDINNQGWVIGTSATADNRIYSFLYLDGTMFNLEKLLNPDAREHWSALSAWDINDRGQILVSGAFNPRGTLELALLTPVPELPVWALVLMGLGAVGTTVWRRRAAAA
jgi:probable HAF family extracellular repeat protein